MWERNSSEIKHTVFPRIVRTRSINFTVCVMRGLFEGAVYSRARSIRVRGRIVHAWSINFTVCVMRGLFEGAVYSKGANYSRKYGSRWICRTGKVVEHTKRDRLLQQEEN